MIMRRRIGRLAIKIAPSREEMGSAAAADVADRINHILEEKEEITLILGRGNSQLTFIEALRARQDIAWSRVNVLQLSEWGVPMISPYSASTWLTNHLFAHVTPRMFHRMRADHEPIEDELRRYSRIVHKLDPDISVINIGEGGRFGFNNPPLDFDTDHIAQAVTLSMADRLDEVEHGHFPSLEDTPEVALTLTCRPLILRPRHVHVLAPGSEKAAIVSRILNEPVNGNLPASILKEASNAILYLDAQSARGIGQEPA